jgi:hypothetical protein
MKLLRMSDFLHLLRSYQNLFFLHYTYTGVPEGHEPITVDHDGNLLQTQAEQNEKKLLKQNKIKHENENG